MKATDDEVRAVRAALIDASWNDAAHFEALQEAWAVVAMAWGIEGVEKNGYGKVRRFLPRSEPQED